jgi:hypothetical protein
MMKYSERVSGSHWGSKGGSGPGWNVPGVGIGVVSSGVGRTVAVAGVLGAGVLSAVFAGVFCGVPFPRRIGRGAGGGLLTGLSGRCTRKMRPRKRSSYIIRTNDMNVVARNVTETFSFVSAIRSRKST